MGDSALEKDCELRRTAQASRASGTDATVSVSQQRFLKDSADTLGPMRGLALGYVRHATALVHVTLWRIANAVPKSALLRVI